MACGKAGIPACSQAKEPNRGGGGRGEGGVGGGEWWGGGGLG